MDKEILRINAIQDAKPVSRPRGWDWVPVAGIFTNAFRDPEYRSRNARDSIWSYYQLAALTGAIIAAYNLDKIAEYAKNLF